MIRAISLASMLAAAPVAFGQVSNVDGFVDQPRLFNDFGGSDLSYSSDFAAGTLSIVESGYGSGNFANRHTAWFGEGGSWYDFDYGDRFEISTTLQINEATDVGNVEAGIQADLFGFGLFGVQTASGEIAAFGSTLPFFSFGSGLYNVGDVVMLEMIYTPGPAESGAPVSTIEYLYNNVTTGSGWVSSGLIDFSNGEGGFPSAFTQNFGIGAQINQPNATTGSVDIQFSNTSIVVPAPGAIAAVGLAGGLMARRRR